MASERAGAIADRVGWRVCRGAAALVSGWGDFFVHCKQLYFIWNIWTLSQFRHCPGESKIANFDRAIAADQDIGWLEVPMHNISRMNIVD